MGKWMGTKDQEQAIKKARNKENWCILGTSRIEYSRKRND